MTGNVSHVVRLDNDVEFLDESKPMGMQRSKILQRSILVKVVELILGLLKDKADNICKMRIRQLKKTQHSDVAMKCCELLDEKFGVGYDDRCWEETWGHEEKFQWFQRGNASDKRDR